MLQIKPRKEVNLIFDSSLKQARGNKNTNVKTDAHNICSLLILD